MKKFYLVILCLITTLTVGAKLSITKDASGLVTLTLNATGDLAAEFTGEYGQTQASADLTKTGALTARKLKIVTKNGATLTDADMKRLCGVDNTGNFQQFKVVDLDLSESVLSDESSLKRLGYLTTMKKVTFPKTTTQVPGSTFLTSSKSQIEEVVIPDNPNINLTLGNQAFHTTSLKKIVFGARNEITMGTLVFQGSTNLTTVDFRYGSKNIKLGSKVFEGCTALENIILPEGVTEIGREAFQSSGVKYIRLPNSLKYIRSKAFAYCEQLKSITIPEGVEQIEETAFENNYNLSDVYVLGTKTKCAEGAFTDNNTYQYNLNGFTGNGQTGVKISDYTKGSGMQTHTVLHFKEEAYKDYANKYIQLLGTPEFDNSGYDKYAQNRWVYDEKGNKLPVTGNNGYFERSSVGTTHPYAGWNNFALIDGKLKTEIFEYDKPINDKWYSMCLPFDMTESELKSAYGAGVEVVEFSGVELGTTTDGKKMINLQFKKPVKSTKAHHPYMIHPSLRVGEAGVKVTITGINKKSEQEQLEFVTFNVDGVDYKFIGNYADNKKMPANSYFWYNGKGAGNGTFDPGFYKRTEEGGKWGKYTALVVASKDDGVRSKAGTAFYIETPEGETTGIDTVLNPQTTQNKQHVDKVMNLNGQVVRNGSSLENLPRGIYIVNGKKYIVK